MFLYLSFFIIFILCLFFILFIIKKQKIIKNENFKNEKIVKDFDKDIIELEKVKNDKSNLDNFKPKKESEVDFFCLNTNDIQKCYRQ